MNELERVLVPGLIGSSLAASRAAGFVVTSPFPGEHVGATARVALVVAIGLIAPGVTALHPAPTVDLPLIGWAFAEVVCGAVIGLGFRLALVSADLVGELASHATGLSTPSVLNPASGASETPIARVITLLALALVVASGAHRVALAHLLASFVALPPGTAFSATASAPVAIGAFVDAIATGARLGAPLAAVSLVAQGALAILARAAPSLQIFSIGFAVIVLTGFGALAAALPDLSGALLASFSRVPVTLDEMVSAMSAR